MAQAQLIQGTGAELLSHLERLRHRKNLLLIIPEEEAGKESLETPKEASAVEAVAATTRNGVPLFPSRTPAQRVTMELVKRLAEEE